MYQEAITRICRSIFPILFVKVIDHGQGHIGVRGTGFFTGEDGYFITAYHVIQNTPEGSDLIFAGNVPHHPLERPVNIEEVYVDERFDIYVGRVPGERLPPLDLSQDEYGPGKSLCLCGYPMPQIRQNEDGSINLSNVRQYWQPTFYIDGFTGEHNGRQLDGFITQHTSLKGMSGGPVFDIGGLVAGMDMATFTRIIPEQGREDTIVPNGIATKSSRILQVLGEL